MNKVNSYERSLWDFCYLCSNYKKKPLHGISLYKRVSIRVRNEMYPTEKHTCVTCNTCKNHCFCSLNMQIRDILVKRLKLGNRSNIKGQSFYLISGIRIAYKSSYCNSSFALDNSGTKANESVAIVTRLQKNKRR